MRRRIATESEVARCANQSRSEVVHPDTIHDDARGERIIWIDDSACEFQPSAAVTEELVLAASQARQKTCRRERTRVTGVATKEDDGRRFACEGAAAACDAVIAAGGDGTVNAVVNGLVGSSIPLGIIPLGTANDFAQQAGIPDDPREAFEIILRTEPIAIDTAAVGVRAMRDGSTKSARPPT